MPDMKTQFQTYGEDDTLAAQFVDWSSDAVRELRQLVDSMEPRNDEASATIDCIYEVSHNIKGMGASFDYALLTTIGTSLCGYLKARKDSGKVSQRVVDAHVRALEVVLEHKIVGRGGDKGAAVERRLAEIILEDTPS